MSVFASASLLADFSADCTDIQCHKCVKWFTSLAAVLHNKLQVKCGTWKVCRSEQGSHSNVRIKKIRTLSGLFSTLKKSGPNIVPFRVSNNKVDNNNCNIWAQDADEHTRNTNCSTCSCKYTYKIASLVHCTLMCWLMWFFRTTLTKNQHFFRTSSGPMSKFRTF